MHFRQLMPGLLSMKDVINIQNCITFRQEITRTFAGDI